MEMVGNRIRRIFDNGRRSKWKDDVLELRAACLRRKTCASNLTEGWREF